MNISRLVGFGVCFEGVFIIHRQTSDNEAVGSHWGIPKSGDTPLGFAKLPSLGTLGFVINGFRKWDIFFERSCRLL